MISKKHIKTATSAAAAQIVAQIAAPGNSVTITGPSTISMTGKKISAAVSKTPVVSCIDVVAAGRMKVINTLFSA